MTLRVLMPRSAPQRGEARQDGQRWRPHERRQHASWPSTTRAAVSAHGSSGRIAGHISLEGASPFTASRDFVTWSAGEILSSADEYTATILRSGAMTKVVRSVNA